MMILSDSSDLNYEENHGHDYILMYSNVLSKEENGERLKVLCIRFFLMFLTALCLGMLT